MTAYIQQIYVRLHAYVTFLSRDCVILLFFSSRHIFLRLCPPMHIDVPGAPSARKSPIVATAGRLDSPRHNFVCMHLGDVLSVSLFSFLSSPSILDIFPATTASTARMNKGGIVFAGGLARRCFGWRVRVEAGKRIRVRVIVITPGQRGTDAYAARGKERMEEWRIRRGVRRETAGTDRRLRRGSEWRQRYVSVSVSAGRSLARSRARPDRRYHPGSYEPHLSRHTSPPPPLLSPPPR